MRAVSVIAVGLWLLLMPAGAETPPSPAPAEACSGKSAKDCGVSKADFKKAREAFERGLRLKSTQPEEALNAFTLAMHLVPGDAKYVSTRELFVQQVVYEHVERGNQLLSQGDRRAAATQFRRALELDPGNKFASQRLLDASAAPSRSQPAYSEPDAHAQEPLLHAKPGEQTLHLRTDARGAYSTIASAFGIQVTFDSPIPSATVHLDLDQITFEQAMNAVALVTRTFWAPLSRSEVIVAADNPGKRKQFERWLLRTFYLPQTSSPEELNEIATLLRSLFELNEITQSPANGTLTVRGPAPAVEAASAYLHTLRAGRPQVMIDFDVYQITREMLRDVGIMVPQQFSVFPISQPGVTVRTPGSLPTAALVSQAQQQNSAGSLLSNLITFGGGKTLMGVQTPDATAQLSQNDSRVISLSKVTMRGSQGNATIFRLGTRYPVITSLFASGTPTLGSFPQVTYQDLGVTVKVTPMVHSADVTLDVEMEVASLGSQVFNGIPTIASRRYRGAITVRNDEPAVVAGSVSQSEVASLSGLPGLSRLPVLGRIASTRNTDRGEDELLVIVTPRVVAAAPSETSTALVVPRN